MPAVRGQRRTSDQPGIVGGQKNHAAGDFLGFPESTDRNLRQDFFLQYLLGHPLDHVSGDIARTNSIDGDADTRAFLGKALVNPISPAFEAE